MAYTELTETSKLKVFKVKELFYDQNRNVTTGKFMVRPLQCWGRIYPPNWNSVKVSENLGATIVALENIGFKC